MASIFRPLIDAFSGNKADAAKKDDTGVSDSLLSPIVCETSAGSKSETNVAVPADQNQPKDAVPNETVNHNLENDAEETSEHESTEEKDNNSDDNCEDEIDEDDNYEYDDEDYEYDIDLIEADLNYNLASKFDDMDLPPGAEATVDWLAPPSQIKRPKETKYQPFDETAVPYKDFKRFDTVEDSSDHKYAKGSKPAHTSEWVRRIQHEWKMLESDLPDTIFVRAYEDRLDLLRAAIIGPVGTPYHDGLFFFDIQFPGNYPQGPPLVNYHSGGLRLNPNLYNCGKVCLSLLGTWSGEGCEKWNPKVSTMLQVLVSIQALVLNDNPYFNEPGYANSVNTEHGKNKSLKYNENTFILSCRTMLYSLRNSPKHFEDLVAEHFRIKGRTILAACRAYIDGVQVGGDFKDEDEDKDADDEGDGSLTAARRMTAFTEQVEKLFEDLLMEFSVKGADCDKFLNFKLKTGLAAAKARLKAEEEKALKAQAAATAKAAEEKELEAKALCSKKARVV